MRVSVSQQPQRGNSEAELDESRNLFKDALSATRTAVEEGILPGGEVVFVCGKRALSDIKFTNLEQQTEIEIVHKQSHRLFDRSRETRARVELKLEFSQRLQRRDRRSFGEDTKADSDGNMCERRIVNSTKVVRFALLNTASVAASMTSINCLIVENSELKTPLLREVKSDIDDLKETFAPVK
jgi:chaperonin GroEL